MGIYYKGVSRDFLKELLIKNEGVNINKIKVEKYVWKKRKNGRFGWVKQ